MSFEALIHPSQLISPTPSVNLSMEPDFPNTLNIFINSRVNMYLLSVYWVHWECIKKKRTSAGWPIPSPFSTLVDVLSCPFYVFFKIISSRKPPFLLPPLNRTVFDLFESFEDSYHLDKRFSEKSN